jgi:hypothetical protein
MEIVMNKAPEGGVVSPERLPELYVLGIQPVRKTPRAQEEEGIDHATTIRSGAV